MSEIWIPPAIDFPSDGERVSWFVESHCIHTKGFRGPIIPEEWTRWLLSMIFRVDQRGLRYWRQILVMLPRKNAKSTISSGVGLYCLSPYDAEPGPDVISAAWGTDQARNVHTPARMQVQQSPRLADMFRPFRNSIICPRNGGSWNVISKIAAAQEGLNIHLGIIDEVHIHPNDSMIDVLLRGTQARSQGSLLMITTEGAAKQSPLGAMQEGVLASGDVYHPHPFLTVAEDHASRFLMVRWGVPWGDDADPEDPAVVRACNPASWLDPQVLIDQYLKAPGKTEAKFRRYHLNQLVEGGEEGIPAASWDACSIPGVKIPNDTPVWLGVDVGYRDDLSFVVAAGWVDGRLAVEYRSFEPPEEGELYIDGTVGVAVDEYMRRFQVRAIATDPWAITSLMQTWQMQGWPVYEYRQAPNRTCPASVRLLEAIEKGTIAHDGSNPLRQHVLNMVVRDIGNAWRFDKSKDTSKKIDGGIALLMAVDMALNGENPYESRGILTI